MAVFRDAGGAAMPPDSVQKRWLKDLSGSVALHGPDAKPVQKPRVQFESLGRSSLVTRSVTIPTLASPEAQVDDEPIVVVIESSAKDTSAYPSGTTDNRQQHTWNARVRALK